ncbi:MAG TPA: CHRD domain-containing protein [Phycisphaerales bacterium]|nr:CHRD domain-containing protein [Phycisphaerales bacterium]
MGIRTIALRTFAPAALALAALAPMADAEIYTRVAVLSAMQEVPTNASTAQGYGRFVIDTVANTMSYRIVYAGLTSAETAAHIHGMSDPGVNSGVVHALPSGPVKVGVWNYAEAQENDILNGRTYVNVHTTNFGGGEIRGQIVSGHAELDTGQEVPPLALPGRGFALFNIDATANTLRYYISYGGLASAETAAHIHGFSMPGTSSGVLHGLPAANPKVGVWNYTEAQEQRIIDGMTYVNIHTVNNGGGELRGQIVFSVNPIDGQQEVGPVTTPATGGALISLDRANNILGYDIRRLSLSSNETAAHIHGYAPVGANAGVVHTLPAGSPKRGTWTFGAANAAAVLDASTYVNIHTVNFGGGEVRGQIFWPSLFPCSPLVTTNPTDVTVTSGGSAQFTVAANPRGGGGPNYQWRRNGSPLSNAASFSGVNSATLTINPATAAEQGSYDCVVSNSCGGMASTAAKLTVTGGCPGNECGPQDFNGDGDSGTDQDIEAFFACLGGNCCDTCFCQGSDFNGDGDIGTDQDIEAFFRVLGGTPC